MTFVRKATKEDAPEIIRLLRQISTLHSVGRPEIFKPDSTKYTEQELTEQIENKKLIIFVAEEEAGTLLGYAICILRDYQNNNVIHPHKVLYLDDLCVDEEKRGKKVGQLLMDVVEAEAAALGCMFVELNVWVFNKRAIGFYERNGFSPRSIRMEKKL
ncbi:MAG TPA: GNAT family N-acetyltransferase [Clostridiales bacterium]|nr:GNAT family N-acetyltransferase [Clostridiales bacterium]